MDKRINPTALSDAELEKHLQGAWHSAVGNYVPEAQASLLIAEMGRRQTKKVTQLSLGISILALVVASVSAIFSFIDWRSDLSWQQEQIAVLRSMAAAKNMIPPRGAR